MPMTLDPDDITAIVAALVAEILPVRLADGVAHGGTPGSSTATLALKSVGIYATGGDDAITLNAQSGGNVIAAEADGGGDFLTVYSEGFSAINMAVGSGMCLYMAAGTDSNAVQILGTGTGAAVQLGDGSSGAEALKMLAGPDQTAVVVTATNGTALLLQGQNGPALTCLAIDAVGVSLRTIATDPGNDCAGLEITGAGVGHDVSLDGDGKFWDEIENAPVTVTCAGMGPFGVTNPFVVDTPLIKT